MDIHPSFGTEDEIQVSYIFKAISVFPRHTRGILMAEGRFEVRSRQRPVQETL